MKRIFGDLKMSWLFVIIFSIIVGVYTGLIMLVPALKETSFQDIGISYECWVIFAVVIVVNCKKNWEAMLKCFVFFLISQPIVYLVQLPGPDLTLGDAVNYYINMWGPMTLLTLPGGLIAYYCKKQNVLGAVILGLGNTIQAVLAVVYFGMAFNSMPYFHHILSGILCVVSIFVMTFQIQKKKTNRLISILIAAVLLVAIVVFCALTERQLIPQQIPSM